MFEISQNEPNPFNELSKVRLFVPQADILTITITDVSGQLVHSEQKRFEKDEHVYQIDDRIIPISGVYTMNIVYRDINKIIKLTRLD